MLPIRVLKIPSGKLKKFIRLVNFNYYRSMVTSTFVMYIVNFIFVQFRSSCKSGVIKVKSMCDSCMVPSCLKIVSVGSFSSKMFKLLSKIKCSNMLPLCPRSLFWSCHNVLWLLKSPVSMKGFGSCLIKFSRSVCVKSSSGLMYKLQIVISLCNLALTAIAWNLVLRSIGLKTTSSCIKSATPPWAGPSVSQGLSL